MLVAGEFHILTICQDNKDIICVLSMVPPGSAPVFSRYADKRKRNKRDKRTMM